MIKKLILSLCFMLMCSRGFCAINFDVVSSGDAFDEADIIFSHTTASESDLLLIVGVEARLGDIISVKYNGILMTEMNSEIEIKANFYITTWYLIAPDTGANNVVVDLDGVGNYSDAIAMSFYGVKQQAPEATSSASGVSTTITDSLTTITDNAWVIDFGGAEESNTRTVGAGQTDRWNGTVTIFQLQASTEPVATAGAATMSWSMSTSTAWGTHLSAWEEASAPARRRFMQ